MPWVAKKSGFSFVTILPFEVCHFYAPNNSRYVWRSHMRGRVAFKCMSNVIPFLRVYGFEGCYKNYIRKMHANFEIYRIICIFTGKIDVAVIYRAVKWPRVNCYFKIYTVTFFTIIFNVITPTNTFCFRITCRGVQPDGNMQIIQWLRN